MTPERISSIDGDVIEDDMYSEDPERRKLYYLNSVYLGINGFITSIASHLDGFPANASKTLQTGTSDSIVYFNKLHDIIPPLHREQAQALINEISAIAHEKGFRFHSSLNTSREHSECGSSGYGGIYWDTDPDIPIPLLRARLIQEGKLTPDKYDKEDRYTVEEVDRARRLAEKTRLDITTGRVTSEVDQAAASDSYYFLSPQKREEVIRREQGIVAEFEEIAKATIAKYAVSRDIIPVLATYADGRMTTPKVLEKCGVIAEQCSQLLPDFINQIKGLKRLGFEAGKWDFVLTPQEILLRLGGIVDPGYLDRPFTPLAIQEGLSVSEVTKLRQGEGSMVVNTTLLGEDIEMPFGFRLEELDEQGSTVKSPTFLKEDGETSIDKDKGVRESFGPRMNFPFARPDDWFYKREKQPLPIIETDEFNITEQDIMDSITHMQQEIESLQEGLNDPNEKIRTKLKSMLPGAERQLAALTWASPDEILAKVRTIYEKTLALAKTGLTEMDIAGKIFEEFQEITDYSDLIERKTRWGYNLVQTVIAHKIVTASTHQE